MVAMSGGVDSSVTLLMLKQAGYRCEGITMKLVEKKDEQDAEGSCSREKESEGTDTESNDVKDARKVASALNVPFRVVDLCDMFREKVIEPFSCAYEHGETPNPCVRCNKEIKFGYLHELRKKLGIDYLATGHYARIEQDDETGKMLLKKASDKKKDQSYFLYSLTQEQLSHTLFPMADIVKEDTRKLARMQGLVTSNKKESQDICFVPDGKYAEVIRRHRAEFGIKRKARGSSVHIEDASPNLKVFEPLKAFESLKAFEPGEFVDKEGNVLGTHKGIINYTVGQRKGLGLSLKKPGYVYKIDAKNNRVIIGDNEDLFTREFDVKEVNFISCEKLEDYRIRNGSADDNDSAFGMRLNVRIRYNQKEQPATVIQTGKDTLHVIYDEPQRAITSGQAAVLYDGDIVVGGGIIV